MSGEQTGTQQGDTPIHALSSEDLGRLSAQETGTGEEAAQAGAERQQAEQAKADEEKAKAEAEKAQQDPEKDTLRAENEKLKRRAEEQEKILARYGTEIGLLRKKTPEQVQAKLKEIRDIYAEDPIRGNIEWKKFQEEQEIEAQAAKTAQFEETSKRTKETVTQLIPEFETTLEDMAALVKADGLEDRYVEMFKKNPYMLDHTTLFNLNKRASLHKQVTALSAENEALKKENAELKAKPAALVKKIEQAAQTRTVTGSNGGATGADTKNPAGKNPAQMSAKELAELRSQLSQ